jgi:hypothetical protein
MIPWSEFCRLHHHGPDGFFGCVDRHGVWFDSSESFHLAVHWCALQHGMSLETTEQEIDWLNTAGRKLGLSIIHSDQLRKMYEAGLIS